MESYKRLDLVWAPGGFCNRPEAGFVSILIHEILRMCALPFQRVFVPLMQGDQASSDYPTKLGHWKGSG